jgi:hypothetical protein
MLQIDTGNRRSIKSMSFAAFSGDEITIDPIDVIDAHKRVAIRRIFHLFVYSILMEYNCVDIFLLVISPGLH